MPKLSLVSQVRLYHGITDTAIIERMVKCSSSLPRTANYRGVLPSSNFVATPGQARYKATEVKISLCRKKKCGDFEESGGGEVHYSLPRNRSIKCSVSELLSGWFAPLWSATAWARKLPPLPQHGPRVIGRCQIDTPGSIPHQAGIGRLLVVLKHKLM